MAEPHRKKTSSVTTPKVNCVMTKTETTKAKACLPVVTPFKNVSPLTLKTHGTFPRVGPLVFFNWRGLEAERLPVKFPHFKVD